MATCVIKSGSSRLVVHEPSTKRTKKEVYKCSSILVLEVNTINLQALNHCVTICDVIVTGIL